MTSTKMATRREIFGWAMFDFANQAYTTLIITVIYGVLFTRVIVIVHHIRHLGLFNWISMSESGG
ncbi:MAG: hypothetical protein ABR533_12600 [Desulfonatronovibrio sp.]